MALDELKFTTDLGLELAHGFTFLRYLDSLLSLLSFNLFEALALDDELSALSCL